MKPVKNIKDLFLVKNSQFYFRDEFKPKNEVSIFSGGNIYIYDAISDNDDWYGISAAEIVAFIDAKTSNFNIYFNSPGGSVTGGFSISNSILRAVQRGLTVNAIIDGYCASIATVIANSCSTFQMNNNSFYMIHIAWGRVVGNKLEIKKYIDFLDLCDTLIAQSYSEKWGWTVEEAFGYMAAETIFTQNDSRLNINKQQKEPLEAIINDILNNHLSKIKL